MKRVEFRQTGPDLLSSQVDGKVESDDAKETAFQKASAKYYERRQKFWADFNRGDWWIAIGLYLIISSVAFVVA